MSAMLQRVRWGHPFIQRFGVFHGLRLLFAIEKQLPRRSSAVNAYEVPGYQAPIHLRECVADHATFKQCIVQAQYDFRHMPHSTRLFETYNRLIERGETPVIIDCGGNIGLATRWFARAFPEARIAVVEPEADNFDVLTENTAHLGTRVVRFPGAIWHRPAKLRISNPEAGSAAFRVEELPLSDGDGIRAYTIDEICEQLGTTSPLIVKLDIEGAQSSLFADNTGWVASAHLIVLELDDWLYPWQGTSRNFFSCLSRHPFEYLWHGESIFCFRDFHA